MEKILLITIIIMVYNYIQISKLKVNYVELYSKKIESDFKILQISDFHSNELLNKDEIYNNIKEFNPDLIAMTGDIIDKNLKDFNYTLNMIEDILKLNKNIYFVLGNHEINNPKGNKFILELKKMGIKVLNNESQILDIGDSNINISGLGFYLNEDDYNSISSNLEYESYNILLSHRADKVLNFLSGKEDLILSGHTHGGQIRVPFLGAILAPGQGLNPYYDKGLYKLKNGNLYIDSGSGNSFLPIRLFNPIQISNIRIKPKKNLDI